MIQGSLGFIGAFAVLVLGSVLAILTAIVAKIGGDEVSGSLPVLANHLLEGAASRVPAEHRDRYRAEWQAELALFENRKLAGVRFAWRLRRKARLVGAALGERNHPAMAPESEPHVGAAPASLDADTIAEIVRRSVERTRPQDGPRFQEIVEEMRSIVSDVEQDTAPAALTEDYVRNISSMRRQARTLPTLPAMRPRPSVSIRRPSWVLREEMRLALKRTVDASRDVEWDDGPEPYDQLMMRRARERQGKSLFRRFALTAKEWSRGEIWL